MKNIKLKEAKLFIASLPKRIFEKTRQAEIVAERVEAIKKLRDEFGLSFPHIGLIFEQDHTTIMYHYFKSGGKKNERKKELLITSPLLSPERMNSGMNYEDYKRND